MMMGLTVQCFGRALFVMSDYVNVETGRYSHSWTESEARDIFEDAVRRMQRHEQNRSERRSEETGIL